MRFIERVSKTKNKKEKGAVMIEFAVASLLMIFIVGFLFDIMLIYFKNQILVTTVTRGTRGLAVNFPAGFNLSQFNTGNESQNALRLEQLSDHIKQVFINHINSNFLNLQDDPANPTFQVSTRIEQSGMTWSDQRVGDVQLHVDVEWNNICVFCFFPIPAKAASQSPIEDECFF